MKSMRSIGSFSQKAQWYSPAAVNMCQPHLDLLAARFSSSNDSWHKFDKAWLPCLLSIGPMLLWGPMSTTPYVVLGQLTGEVTMGWPVGKRTYGPRHGIPGSAASADDHEWLELLSELTSPAALTLLMIFDPSEWQAQPFTFTAPLSQARRRPGFDFQHGRLASIRIGPSGIQESLLLVAARRAFGQINSTMISNIIAVCGLESMNGESLFNKLRALTRHVLLGVRRRSRPHLGPAALQAGQC